MNDNQILINDVASGEQTKEKLTELNKNLEKYTVDKHTQKIEKDCIIQQNITSPRNALNDELNEFIKCIINKKEPIINGINAQSALKIALQIQEEIIG